MLKTLVTKKGKALAVSAIVAALAAGPAFAKAGSTNHTDSPVPKTAVGPCVESTASVETTSSVVPAPAIETTPSVESTSSVVPTPSVEATPSVETTAAAAKLPKGFSEGNKNGFVNGLPNGFTQGNKNGFINGLPKGLAKQPVKKAPLKVKPAPKKNPVKTPQPIVKKSSPKTKSASK